MNNIRISNSMLMALIINLVYAKAIGLTQGIMAREVGNDIWISTLFATAQGILIMLLTVLVIRRLPEKNLIEQVEVMLGRVAGIICSIIVFIFFVGAYCAVLITFVYHLMDYFLPGFPVLIFVAVAVLIPIYAVFHGLEVSARIAIVGVFSIIALNLLLLAGALNEFDVHNLMPVLDTGLGRTLLASRHNDTDWGMATMMTAMMLPLVKDKTTWSKAGAGGILFGSILVIMWPILECGVLTAQETGQYIVACMQLARSAQIGLFIHRYEMIMIAFFAISLLIQLMVTVLCGSMAIAQMGKLKDYRPAIVPVAIGMGATGYFVVKNHIRAMWLLSHYWPSYGLSIAIGLPLVVWVSGWFFKVKLGNAQKRLPSPVR